MNVDDIDTYSPSAVLNFQCSDSLLSISNVQIAVLCLPGCWAPRSMVLTTGPSYMSTLAFLGYADARTGGLREYGSNWGPRSALPCRWNPLPLLQGLSGCQIQVQPLGRAISAPYRYATSEHFEYTQLGGGWGRLFPFIVNGGKGANGWGNSVPRSTEGKNILLASLVSVATGGGGLEGGGGGWTYAPPPPPVVESAW